MKSGIVLIAGVRGSGKTHRIRELIIRNVARGRRVRVFDPSRDISTGLLEHYAGRQEGQRHFVRRYLTVADYAAAKSKDPPLVACVCPGTDSKPTTKAVRAEAPKFREQMADDLWEGLVWVCDEGELLFEDWGHKSDSFPMVILARNSGSLIIVACKDPVRVGVDVRRGADCVLLFVLATPEAAASMRDTMDPKTALSCLSLRKRQFLYLAPASESEVRGQVTLLGAEDDLPEEL